jgi:hypothetical protein
MASTTFQNFKLSFGEYNTASDLSIVTYPLFRAALLTISAATDAPLSYAQAFRNNIVTVPINFGGVPAFRIDSLPQVPPDPAFPKLIFHAPWIVYLSAQRAVGVNLAREILTESTPDGGLLMSATTERLDPTNPEHVRRARILAETMIALTATSERKGEAPEGGWLGLVDTFRTLCLDPPAEIRATFDMMRICAEPL